MEFYEELKPSLQACQNPDKTIRKEGEKKIKEFRDADPKKFIATLTKEIADETNDDGVRQLAGIIFKNFIVNLSKDEKYVNYWINMEVEFKGQIKNAILATLASPKTNVRNQIANILAQIGKIEIPRKEWNDLIPSMCTNSKSDDMNIRLASLKTLGYICEELQTNDLDDTTKNSIILALLENLMTDEVENGVLEPSKLAIAAFVDSIPFTAPNFQSQQERDFIMDKIFVACGSADEDIQENSLHCLREIAVQEYEFIDLYFVKVCQVTGTASKSANNKIGAASFEFWTALSEEEIERKANGTSLDIISKSATVELVQMIISGLQVINFEEDEDDDEWGHAQSAACALIKLSILQGDTVMTPVINFVSANLQSQDWKMKYASLMALGSITEGPNKQNFLQIIIQAFQNLMAMFQDSNSKVREAISWVMSRMSEHHSDLLTNTQIINQFIMNIVQGTMDKPSISYQCCDVLQKLAENCAPNSESQQQNALTPFFQDIYTALDKNSVRQDFQGTGHDLLQSSLITMTALIQHACIESHGQIYDIMIPILQKLEQSVQVDAGQAVHIQDLLCGVLQVILVKIGKQIQKPLVDNIITVIIAIFTQSGKVTDNGLIAFQGLVAGLGEQGVQILDLSQIGVYIKHALESKDSECAGHACGIISDLSSSLQEKMNDYLDDFVPCLQGILKDNDSYDRKIKNPALSALGDLAMYCSTEFNKKYLESTFSILFDAASVSVRVQAYQNDQDTLEFLSQLREGLIDQITFIMMELHESGQIDVCIQYLEKIYDFLEAYADIQGQHDIKVAKNIIALIGDIATYLPKNEGVKVKSTLPYVEQLIVKLQNQSNLEYKEQANYTLEAIKALIANFQ